MGSNIDTVGGLTEFQKNAVAIALKKMYKDQKYFCISTVDSILKMTDKLMPKKDYEAVQLLHCVDWEDIGQDMMRESFNIIIRALESPSFEYDIMDKKLKAVLGKKTNFLNTKMLN